MFSVNDDMSIYVTRGDVVFFTVTADDNGKGYTFNPGDVVRVKITEKKASESVVLQKDFPVTEATEAVQILLTGDETKFGEVISKPTDYWYEIELNPHTNPQTILGYDEDGAKIFKLFPEGNDMEPTPIEPEDIPVVDEELSLTSDRPVQNQAITRAITGLSEDIKENSSEIVATFESRITAESEQRTAEMDGIEREIATERARINNLVANTGEQTSGNSELIDVRVGADGNVYQTAGSAVRGQISNLKNDLSKNLNFFENEEITVEWYRKQVYFSTTDNTAYPDLVTNSTTRLLNVEATNTTDDLIVANRTIKISVDDGFKYACALYKHGVSSGTHFFSRDPNTEWTYYTEPTTWTADGEYDCLLIMLAKTDNGEIALTESNAIAIENILEVSNGVKEEIKKIKKSIVDVVPVTLPFSNFAIETPIYKENGQYRADFNPQKNFIKKTNGVTVFISPNGSHDADGLTVLTPKKTIAECLEVANVQTIVFLEGTYKANVNYFVGETVERDVNLVGLGDVVIDNISDNAPINFKGNLYAENIHFKHGNNTVLVTLDGSQKATFNKCKFSESDTLNGLAVLGGSVYVVDCIAYNNAYDGFNYHANGTIINHAVEINCVGYGNGMKHLTDSGGQSSNATTSHDGSYIVRVNGDYKCCHGGIVADKECKSANYGCRAGVSTITDVNYPDRMSNYWSSDAEMYLYECISYGSKYDTAVINGGRIISDTVYASNYGV